MSAIKIALRRHKKTGLLMATSEDVPGFIVHAHSDDEMADKLVAAYVSFMEAVGRPVDCSYELVNEVTPDFWPPAFVLQSVHKVAA